MTGEPGWRVDPGTRDVLLRVESLGYVVSVHRLPSSLLGTVGASVEMHAVRLGDPPIVHVAILRDGRGEADVHPCACELARMVGVRLRG